MNIALIGYGKMGKMIEECAHEKKEDEIVLKISKENQEDLNKVNLQMADVAIEFTTPASAVSNMMKCLDAGIPVVCGTTGWLEELEKIKDYITEKTAPLFMAATSARV